MASTFKTKRQYYHEDVVYRFKQKKIVLGIVESGNSDSETEEEKNYQSDIIKVSWSPNSSAEPISFKKVNICFLYLLILIINEHFI